MLDEQFLAEGITASYLSTYAAVAALGPFSEYLQRQLEEPENHDG